MAAIALRFIAVLLVAPTLACASVHPGNMATPVDTATYAGDPHRTRLGLLVSGQEIEELGSRYFGVIEFTFENRTDHWIRIKTIALDFGGEEKNREVFLPWGTDLARWYEAASRKLAIEAHNREVFLTTLALAGAVTASVSRSNTGVAAGTAVSLGAATTLALNDYAAATGAAQQAPLYPENHLLAGGFSIPPGLFTKRWVLLNTRAPRPGGYLQTLVMRYESEEAAVEQLRLSFRTAICLSPWQREVCSTPSRVRRD